MFEVRLLSQPGTRVAEVRIVLEAEEEIVGQ